MPRQTLFPFTREEQAAAIAAAVERLRPALSTVKLLGLRALLDAVLTAPRTDRGELPLDALAARLDRSTRSAWSLLKAAEALGLVVVERADGMRRPHCVRLDFDGLRLVAREGTKPAASAEEHGHEAAAGPIAKTVDFPSVSAEEHSQARAFGPGPSTVSPSPLVFAHVRKDFPNVRKVFPNGKTAADDVCLLYIPPYPPSPSKTGPTDGDAKTAGGGVGFGTSRGSEGAAFGEPTRSKPGPAAGANTSSAAGWTEAAAALTAAGLGAVGPALEQARGRGLSPGDVVAACRTFDANRAKFKSAGALRFWLANGVWPTDAAVVDPVERDRRRDEAEARQTRQRVEAAAARAANVAEADDAEREHGAALDGLGEADRDALAAAVLRAPGLLDAYRRGRWSGPGLVRECLLAALAARSVNV